MSGWMENLGQSQWPLSWVRYYSLPPSECVCAHRNCQFNRAPRALVATAASCSFGFSLGPTMTREMLLRVWIWLHRRPTAPKCGRRHRNLIKTPYLDCSLSLGVIVSKQRSLGIIRRRKKIIAQFFTKQSWVACAAGIIALGGDAGECHQHRTLLHNAAVLFGMMPINVCVCYMRAALIILMSLWRLRIIICVASRTRRRGPWVVYHFKCNEKIMYAHTRKNTTSSQRNTS